MALPSHPAPASVGSVLASLASPLLGLVQQSRGDSAVHPDFSLKPCLGLTQNLGSKPQLCFCF